MEDRVRVDWGLHGLRALAPGCDAIVIVDVLSFTTCVAVAAARGATVLPCQWRDESAGAYARQCGAELAGSRGRTRWTLSPRSYADAPAGLRVVLASPNGSALTMEAAQALAAQGASAVLAGSLRNAAATARAAARRGRRIGIVAAGERWPDDSLRPCLEDWVGAGAVVWHLPGPKTAEARAAQAAFLECRADLPVALLASPSGQELADRGYGQDVTFAAEVDVPGAAAAVFADGGYRREEG